MKSSVLAPAGAILTIICRSLPSASSSTRTVRSSPAVTAARSSLCLIWRTSSRASVDCKGLVYEDKGILHIWLYPVHMRLP